MARETKKEKAIRLVRAIGYLEDHGDRSKYYAFYKPGVDQRYFVGDNGALRCGKNASQSISISHLLPQLFKKYGIE